MFSSSILCDRGVCGAQSCLSTGKQEVIVVHDHHPSSVCKLGSTIHETLCICTIHTFLITAYQHLNVHNLKTIS